MAGERHGVISYPGLQSFVSGTYTCSHGITPGEIIIVCNPQDKPLPPIGDVTLTDGVGTLILRDCRITDIKSQRDGQGVTTWVISLRDRRWRWQFGAIRGAYNVLDPHSKLKPMTIRSPVELAVAALTAMGEVNYELNLPPGLDRSFG